MNLISSIKDICNHYFPNKKINSVIDRGLWVRRIIKVEFNNGDIIFIKITDDTEDYIHEKNVVDMFTKHSIPAPRVIVTDNSLKFIPYPFIIQEYIGGVKLGAILIQESQQEIIKIYKNIGKIYKKMHSVKNHTSGLWSTDPYKVRYPISPNDYMYNAEIVNGSGKQAVENNIISKELYEKIVNLWKDNIKYLKDHKPSMIHISPFIWNIYVDKINGEWEVTKLMSLGDVVWWDVAYDLATIKYPPFSQYSNANWEAFIEGYGQVPDEKRLLLYALMHRLCGTMGVYMEPNEYKNNEWTKLCESDLQKYIKQIENS